MKKMFHNVRNALYAGLIGASALVASGADRTPAHELADIVREGIPSNVGVTVTKFGKGFDKKPYVHEQTPFVVIPPITDLTLSPHAAPLRASDYAAFFASPGTNTIPGTKEGLTALASRVRPNLATIVRYQLKTNDTGAVLQHVTGVGSGTLLTSDGFLLTNDHVIGDPAHLYQALSFSTEGDTRWYPLTVCATSPKRDLALGKLAGASFPDVIPLPLREKHILPHDQLLGLNLEYGQATRMGTELKVGTQKVQTLPFQELPFYLHTEGNTSVLTPSFETVKPLVCMWSGSAGQGPFSPIDSALRGGRLNEFQEKSLTTTGNTYEYLIPCQGKGEPGNSGSALFDSQGALMGVTSLGHGTDNKMHMVSPHSVRDFLRQYNARTMQK